MEVNGKVAVVTGGGTGIGRAVALLLARRGADVTINYSRSKAEAEVTAAEVERLSRRAVCIRADVSDPAAVEGMMAETVARLGRLDILVNNAGFTRFVDFKDLEAIDDDTWDRTMAVNVKGPFYCTRAAAPHMRRVGGGVVVNVSSVAARLARGSSIPYCCSKAALDVLTRIMAKALAPEIRVNAVAPGVVQTRWVEGQKAFVRGAQMQTPLRRIASPDDVAQAVLSLIAGCDFVTGAVLAVDGGISA